MADEQPAAGPVEARTRAFVASLGELSPRGAVQAEAAIRAAQLLDREERGSAATALARELRLAVAALEPRQASVPAPAEETVQARAASVAVDSVQAIKDRRAERLSLVRPNRPA